MICLLQNFNGQKIFPYCREKTPSLQKNNIHRYNMLDFIAVTHLFPSKSTSYPQFYPHISSINRYFSAIAVKNLQSHRYYSAIAPLKICNGVIFLQINALFSPRGVVCHQPPIY